MLCFKPIIIENSKLPTWLSKLSPIEVWAFSFGPFIVCRGKLSEQDRRHEIIHYYQQLEMLFVFQWVMYALFYIIGRLRFGSWEDAYYNNPFEKEAYSKQSDKNYLKNRRFYALTKHISTLKM